MLNGNFDAIKSFAEEAALDLIIVRSVFDELSDGGAASTALENVAKAFKQSGFRVFREGHFWNINLQ